jgi:hypothetical protein
MNYDRVCEDDMVKFLEVIYEEFVTDNAMLPVQTKNNNTFSIISIMYKIYINA